MDQPAPPRSPAASGPSSAPDRLTTTLDSPPTAEALPPGTSELRGLPGRPPALAWLPPRSGDEPLPLVVALHGAGSRPERSLDLWRDLADRDGFAVLAPKSSGPTWDRVRGAFGPDVGNLDAVLRRFTRHTAVSGVALAGFSDGASYALSLGLSNGDLVSTVVAFSPGFAAPGTRRGRPPVFVSHGVGDTVLPIDRCSRRLVPALRQEGYAVTYREFDGGHEVPVAVRAEAARWLSERR